MSSGGKRPEACLECGDSLRPDVVLFGEMLPPGAFELAAERAARCELCFVIGTSGLVYPAAGLPEIARSAGAFVCEVNPERTPLSSLCDEVLMGKAGEVLPLFRSHEDSLLRLFRRRERRHDTRRDGGRWCGSKLSPHATVNASGHWLSASISKQSIAPA